MKGGKSESGRVPSLCESAHLCLREQVCVLVCVCVSMCACRLRADYNNKAGDDGSDVAAFFSGAA